MEVAADSQPPQVPAARSRRSSEARGKVRFSVSPMRSEKTASGEVAHAATPVLNLACCSCGQALSTRGMHVRLVADASTTMYSTDSRPNRAADHGDVRCPARQCECQVQDFACACGVRIGYQMVDRCGTCTVSQEDGSHSWFMNSRCVNANLRRDENGDVLCWTRDGKMQPDADLDLIHFASPTAAPEQESLGCGANRWPTLLGAVPPLPGLGSDGQDLVFGSPLGERNGRDSLGSRFSPKLVSGQPLETVRARMVMTDAVRQARRALGTEFASEQQEQEEGAGGLLSDAEVLRDQVQALCALLASKQAVLRAVSDEAVRQCGPSDGPMLRAGYAALQSARLGVEAAHVQGRAARRAAVAADWPEFSGGGYGAYGDAFVEARLQCAQKLVEKREALTQWQDILEERELILCEAERSLEASRPGRFGRLVRLASWPVARLLAAKGAGSGVPPQWATWGVGACAAPAPAFGLLPQGEGQAVGHAEGVRAWVRRASGCGKQRAGAAAADAAEWRAQLEASASCPWRG